MGQLRSGGEQIRRLGELPTALVGAIAQGGPQGDFLRERLLHRPPEIAEITEMHHGPTWADETQSAVDAALTAGSLDDDVIPIARCGNSDTFAGLMLMAMTSLDCDLRGTERLRRGGRKDSDGATTDDGHPSMWTDLTHMASVQCYGCGFNETGIVDVEPGG